MLVRQDLRSFYEDGAFHQEMIGVPIYLYKDIIPVLQNSAVSFSKSAKQKLFITLYIFIIKNGI